jgi:hypothetical protein
VKRVTQKIERHWVVGKQADVVPGYHAGLGRRYRQRILDHPLGLNLAA